MKFDESLKIQKSFNNLIPGGCHTYAKGDDQYPQFMPVYHRAGARAVTSGTSTATSTSNTAWACGPSRSATPSGPSSRRRHRQMLLGTTSSGRPGSSSSAPRSSSRSSTAPTWSSSARTAPTRRPAPSSWPGPTPDGTWSPSAAITPSSRSTTGSSAARPCPPASPSARQGPHGQVPLQRPRRASKELFAEYPGKIACVILEAEKYDRPQNDFLHELKELAHEQRRPVRPRRDDHRIPLAPRRSPEEIRHRARPVGLRQGAGQRIRRFPRWPGDGTSWNSAGCDHDRERVFLHVDDPRRGEPRAGRGAGHHEVLQGESGHRDPLRAGTEACRRSQPGFGELGLREHVSIIGPDCCSVYTTRDQDKKPSQPFRTLFLQETMKRGLLMPSSIVSYSHSDKDIGQTVERISEALVVYRKALDEGIDKYLVGNPVKPGLQKI